MYSSDAKCLFIAPPTVFLLCCIIIAGPISAFNYTVVHLGVVVPVAHAECMPSLNPAMTLMQSVCCESEQAVIIQKHLQYNRSLQKSYNTTSSKTQCKKVQSA